METGLHIVLIHGTWGHSGIWSEMIPELEARGLNVHAPTLRHHELPFLEGALKIGNLSLLDYVEDLVEFVNYLDPPPIIAGISMGGLLAQLVAARCRHKGLILLSPAPAAGMFTFYPSMMRMFYKYFIRWGFWKKPMYPLWEEWRWGVVNQQTHETAVNFFNSLKTESGRAYCEMAFWFLDPKKSSQVDIDRINTPVLVFGGSKDRVVAPRICRLTAKRYKKADYVEFPESDHVMIVGRELKNTMNHIDRWLKNSVFV
jgi:pimeloyl-ACP methyl ester carboxylesterase